MALSNIGDVFLSIGIAGFIILTIIHITIKVIDYYKED